MEENIVGFEDFKKLDLRVARVTLAERVAGSDKLLRLEVELDGGKRQIVAGIGKIYEPALLVGREIIIVANLEPRKLLGLESQGMLLAASDEGGPALLTPDRTVVPGSKIS
jgi:methionine--tRNA ligase beta chain